MTRQAILAACVAVAMIAPAAAQTDANSTEMRDASAASLARSGSNVDAPDRFALARLEQARDVVDPREPVSEAMMGQIAHAARDTGDKNAAAFFASRPRAFSMTSEGEATYATRIELPRIAALGALASSFTTATRETSDVTAQKKQTSTSPRQQRDTALDHVRRFETNKATIASANPASKTKADWRYQ